MQFDAGYGVVLVPQVKNDGGASKERFANVKNLRIGHSPIGRARTCNDGLTA